MIKRKPTAIQRPAQDQPMLHMPILGTSQVSQRTWTRPGRGNMSLAELVRIFGDTSFPLLLVLLTAWNLNRGYWQKLPRALGNSLGTPFWDSYALLKGPNDQDCSFSFLHGQQAVEDGRLRLATDEPPPQMFPEEAHRAEPLNAYLFEQIAAHYAQEQASVPPSVMIEGQYEEAFDSFCDYIRFEAISFLSRKSFDALLADRTIDGQAVLFQGPKFPELHALIRGALPLDPTQAISRHSLQRRILPLLEEIRELVTRIYPSLEGAPGVSFEDAFCCIALHFEPAPGTARRLLPSFIKRHQLSLGQLATKHSLLYTLRAGWNMTHSIAFFRYIVATPQYPDADVLEIIRSRLLQDYPYWPHVIAILAPQRLKALIEDAHIADEAFCAFHNLNEIFADFSLSDELLALEDKEVTLLGAALLAPNVEPSAVGAILTQLKRSGNASAPRLPDVCWRNPSGTDTATFISALCQRSQHLAASSVRDLVARYAQSGFFDPELAKSTPSFFYQILRARADSLFVALLAEDKIDFDPSLAEDLDVCAPILAKNHSYSPKLALILSIYQQGEG
jgi:hypothetical protein